MKRVVNVVTLVSLAIGGLCVAALASCSIGPGSTSGGPVKPLEERPGRLAQERFEKEWNDNWARIQEQEAERKRLREQPVEIQRVAAPEPETKRQRTVRRIRRFRWESPSESRGRVWNIPNEESKRATLEAFLRVCIAEADGSPQDCVGIWQVVKNNRLRKCNRNYVKRVTECEEGGGETFLSALRRHQRHVLGYLEIQNKRARWISKMTLDCEDPPKEFHDYLPEESRLDVWDARYQKRCSQVVKLGRYLMAGQLPPSRPGQRLRWLPGKPITWGGRCETGRAACDDRIACARGLARIPGVDYTENAFWCRIGTPGCRSTPEPICETYGRRRARKDTPRSAES